MLIFWVLVISGIVYLIKLIAGDTKGRKVEETPLEILKKRYAGEITKEEFDRIKDDLQKD